MDLEGVKVVTLDCREDDNGNNEKRINIHDLDPDAPDWPHFRVSRDFPKYNTNDSQPPPVPLLIKECARLMPVKNPQTGYIDWYPFNMPDFIIRRMTIVGTFLELKSNRKYLEFIAQDGTGIITVLYGRQTYERDLRRRMVLDAKYGVSERNTQKYADMMKKIVADKLSNSTMPSHREPFYLKHKDWWMQTALGMKGKSLVVGDYVKIYGFCDVAGKGPLRHESLQKHRVLSPIIFKAYKIDAITETQYNYTLEDWIINDIRKRYDPTP